MILGKGLIEADLIAARQAIEYFEKNCKKDIKNIAAYHLQQATEKIIKLQIYKQSDNVSNSQMYTHNIDRLISYAESLNIEFVVPEYIREHSVQISEWEAGSRYDIHFSIRIDVLKKTLEILSLWVKKI